MNAVIDTHLHRVSKALYTLAVLILTRSARGPMLLYCFDELRVLAAKGAETTPQR